MFTSKRKTKLQFYISWVCNSFFFLLYKSQLIRFRPMFGIFVKIYSLIKKVLIKKSLFSSLKHNLKKKCLFLCIWLFKRLNLRIFIWKWWIRHQIGNRGTKILTSGKCMMSYETFRWMRLNNYFLLPEFLLIIFPSRSCIKIRIMAVLLLLIFNLPVIMSVA